MIVKIYNYRTSPWPYIKSVIVIGVLAVIIFLFASNVLNGGLSNDKRVLFGQIIQENIKVNQYTLNQTKRLRLVSYNLWCDFLKPHTILTIRERIESLAEGIKDFDIALIQEAYILNTGVAVVTKCASLMVAAMTKRGFHYRTSIADFAAPYVGQSGGIVIFSRIPLARTTSRRYHNYSILQVADYRGFVIGEFSFNSKHLYVVNTHLDPHGVNARVSQTKELITATQQFNASSHIVVAGDFNIDNHHATTSNNSEEYKQLLNTMSEAGLQSVFPERVETNIDGGNYDAIFTSSNVAVAKKEVMKLVTKKNGSVSDHFGLSVELNLL